MSIKYFFYPYSKKYPQYFTDEKKNLQKLLRGSGKIHIEHFGSTSVVGLGGKRVVDIIVGIAKNKISSSVNILKKNKYAFLAGGGDDERFFFRKTIGKGVSERFIHLHLTEFGSASWHKALGVRNLLREDKKIRDDYIVLKKKAVKYAKGDGEKYRQYKNPYLHKLAKLALKRMAAHSRTKRVKIKEVKKRRWALKKKQHI
jgi:GrpB-like predicted nucleotidyltransferase (UPF0157 family)